MNRGCWKIDDNDEAVYIDIDIEEDAETESNKSYSRWSELPDLLLEKIFSYLSIREKYYASLVCKSWHRAFYLPYVWSQFVLEDNTLTRGRFNYYSGWQYVLDHLRAQMCLSQVGRNFRKLTFEPMLNFYNLYEFMNMVSWCSEQCAKTDNIELAVGRKIHTLKFTFPCNMTNRDDTERIRLFGTGGKLLAALKRLMSNLKKLRTLELIDLMLDPKEAQFLLDEVCETCCLTLQTLCVINTTRVQYQVLHVGVFLNLQTLVISPQNLGDDVIELLSHTNLTNLHILQNRYTPNDLQPDSLMTVIDFYKQTLRIYGHKNVPRFFRSKSFHERIDGNLVLLVRECYFLTTLIVTERISTATALLLAYTGKNLKYLFIRGNAVIIRCDWPQSPDWSDEFYTWLKVNSRSYKLVEQEISQMFGHKWQFLSDKEFKRVYINLHEM